MSAESSSHGRELSAVHTDLRRVAFDWALHGRLDEARASELRREAAVLNHRHYRATIPHYRRLCQSAGHDVETPAWDDIVRDLLVPDEIFKAYPSRALDTADFAAMGRWLASITDKPVPELLANNLDGWFSGLARQADLNLVFSSGTSGHLSFVPRHGGTWNAFLHEVFTYLPLLLVRRGVVRGWRASLLRGLARWTSPERFESIVRRHGLSHLDGFFLQFSGGNQGVQIVGRETSRLTRRAVFLYEQELSPAAVRALLRGPRSPAERTLVDDFLRSTVRDKERNYERFCTELEISVKKKRPVILFGTPYLLLELTERLASRGTSLVLPPGSHVTFGGGWKSFKGDRIPREQLFARIQGALGLPTSCIVEGYGMTELNGAMLRCEADRYHVPPYLEVILLDDRLEPIDGPDVTGNLAVIDPFAESYPGFLITGDHVRRKLDTCPCGLPGPTILAVERSPSAEVKGCGGIMASVNA